MMRETNHDYNNINIKETYEMESKACGPSGVIVSLQEKTILRLTESSNVHVNVHVNENVNEKSGNKKVQEKTIRRLTESSIAHVHVTVNEESGNEKEIEMESQIDAGTVVNLQDSTILRLTSSPSTNGETEKSRIAQHVLAPNKQEQNDTAHTSFNSEKEIHSGKDDIDSPSQSRQNSNYKVTQDMRRVTAQASMRVTPEVSVPGAFRIDGMDGPRPELHEEASGLITTPHVVSDEENQDFHLIAELVPSMEEFRERILNEVGYCEVPAKPMENQIDAGTVVNLQDSTILRLTSSPSTNGETEKSRIAQHVLAPNKKEIEMESQIDAGRVVNLQDSTILRLTSSPTTNGETETSRIAQHVLAPNKQEQNDTAHTSFNSEKEIHSGKDDIDSPSQSRQNSNYKVTRDMRRVTAQASMRVNPEVSVPGAFRIDGMDGPRPELHEEASGLITTPHVLSDEENQDFHLIAELVPSMEEFRERILNEVGYCEVSAKPMEDLRRTRCQLTILALVMFVAVCGIVGAIVGGLAAKSNSSLIVVLAPSVSTVPSLQPSNMPSLSIFPTLQPTYTPSYSMSPTDILMGINFIVALQPDMGIPDPGTPQFKALLWLSMNKQITTFSDSELRARYAVATLVFTSSQNVSILTDDSHCTWIGIQCATGSLANAGNETLDQITGINATSIFPDWNQGNTTIHNETGFSFPPEIVLLSNSLAYLRYEGERIKGSIPTEFGLLSKLTELSIKSLDNSLLALPAELSTLSDLETLRYGGSSFKVNLAQEGRALLPKLQVLDISNNDFAGGSIPSVIFQFSQLAHLDLSYCNIAGSLPSDLENLKSLTALKLRNNYLGSEIPTYVLTKLSQLETLDVSSNVFSTFESDSVAVYEIPHQFGSLTALTHLDLSTNSFYSSSWYPIANLTNLHHLDLRQAKISGSIPDTFDNFTQLTYLDLSQNKLRSTVPSSLSRIISLAYFNLTGNFLEGSFNCSSYPSQLVLLGNLAVDCLGERASCNASAAKEFFFGTCSGLLNCTGCI